MMLERDPATGPTRKVTEGEIVERMLSLYLESRREGCSLKFSEDVLVGVYAIAAATGQPASAVIEELVVGKVAELGLMPRAL
jgi:hypothetical protein